MGARRKATNTIRQCLRAPFRFNVRDIGSIMKSTSDDCVVASIVLMLLHAAGFQLHSVGALTVKRLMKRICFQDLISPDLGGISVKDFPILEKRSFSKSLQLAFPFLRPLDGFALNVFKLHFNPQLKQYSLHPYTLSKHHASKKHFQVDLLLETESVVDRQNAEDNAGFHVLTILNLPRLLASMVNDQTRHTEMARYACRQCLRYFWDRKLYSLHIEGCRSFTAGTTRKRQSQNKFVHKPSVFVKSLKKEVPNVLRFNLKNLYRLCRPLTFFGLDLEATNETVRENTLYSKAPTNTIFEQCVIGAAFVVKNTYEQYPLPNDLSQPRMLFFDDTKTTKESFWMKFFLMIRTTLAKVVDYEQQVLSIGMKPPKLKDLPLGERLKFLTARCCAICKGVFNSYRKGALGKHRIKRVYDHPHVSFTSMDGKPETRDAALCATCNLFLSQSAISPKNNRVFYCHNLVRYDSVFLMEAICSLMDSHFYQYDALNRRVKTPFFFK